jgi:hypothetical protein
MGCIKSIFVEVKLNDIEDNFLTKRRFEAFRMLIKGSIHAFDQRVLPNFASSMVTNFEYANDTLLFLRMVRFSNEMCGSASGQSIGMGPPMLCLGPGAPSGALHLVSVGHFGHFPI